MSRAARNTQARSSRAKGAKDVIIREIPSILRANARARRGIEATELIIEPPAQASSDAGSSSNTPNSTRTPPKIRLLITDTLEAAHQLIAPSCTESSHSRQRPPRVAVLNMASPLRPGGGVLSGATSQEEWLCSRTTLYPSLKEEFYRLPEVGGIYTPDVMVFRRWDEEATELAKADRFFIDVVSAGMLRFPDLDDSNGEDEKRYAEQKDRDLVVRKMRAVMRILRMKGVDKVVLGAWGCGAYGNPVGEVASAWSKVLLGRKVRGKGPAGDAALVGYEAWDGLEVVFAIKDPKMASRFVTLFGPGIEVEDAKLADRASEREGEEGSNIEAT